jgi:hypothetical protein
MMDVLEEENSPKDILHNLGHGDSRVLGLARRDGNRLGTTVYDILSAIRTARYQGYAAQPLTRERSSDKDGREPADAADERSSRNMPVLGTNVAALGVAATVDDNAHDNENLTGCQLAGCGFACSTSSKLLLTTIVMTLRRLSQYSSCS